jgi:hypothetical protein
MENCKREGCGSTRLALVEAKCSDLCSVVMYDRFVKTGNLRSEFNKKEG